MMSLSDIYLHLREDIQYLERELDKAVHADTRELYQSAVHLLQAGGKRIRPVFVLLAGKWGNYDLNVLKHVAVSLELIHMATLVHDDVIDNAERRRGKETVKAKWDNRVAMYTGDYIFARALTVVAELENPRIHRILSKAILEMCRGEIQQVRDLYNGNQCLRDYLRRIKRKTALLIAISCQLGALATGTPEEFVRRLYLYGYYAGMAFQITDDILDFTGTEQQLGKPAGSDLRQGNITLPALFSLWYGKRGAVLKDWIRRRTLEEHMEEAIDIVRGDGGIEYSRRLAERYLQKATDQLDALPDQMAKTGLLQIARFIGSRNF